VTKFIPRGRKTGGVLVWGRGGRFPAVFAARVAGIPLLATALFALFIGSEMRAQQAAPAPSVKQEVPDNLLQLAAPAQPLPYSHKTHLALGLQCQMCHTNPEPGRLMTFSATGTCMACHATIAKDKPAIQKLAAFAKSGQPIPWVRVYVVLAGVNWTHRKHLTTGMQCEMCHGKVAQLEVMAEITSVTTMASCLNCHQAHNASTACQTCHSWPQ
jgi:hypothetical protein